MVATIFAAATGVFSATVIIGPDGSGVRRVSRTAPPTATTIAIIHTRNAGRLREGGEGG